MTPHKKAKELVADFVGHFQGSADQYDQQTENAKRCALLCVKHIQEGIDNMAHGACWSLEVMDKKLEFWGKVAEHIKKIKV